MTENTELKKTTRRNDIDWLRVMAVFLLFHFHTAVLFYPGMYIQNNESNTIIRLFVMFVHQWHMPLFFILSGMSSFYALSHRTSGRYLLERCGRLLVPLIFGTLLLVPPLVYMQFKCQPEFNESYFEFFPKFFNAPYPTGNFQWAHLWFLAYLFPFSIIALPLFLYFKSDKPQSWLISKAVALCRKPWGIFLFGLPFAIGEAGLRPGWPGLENLYDDWANFFLYLFCFIYGCLICADRQFSIALDKNRRSATILAITFTGVSLAIFIWAIKLRLYNSYNPASMTLHFIRGWNIWFWLVLILGTGQRYLNSYHPTLNYMKEAALPVYVLHQTVLVGIGFYVIQWRVGIWPKFLSIDLGSFLLTILIYDFFVKRWSVTRVMFGMRIKTR